MFRKCRHCVCVRPLRILLLPLSKENYDKVDVVNKKTSIALWKERSQVQIRPRLSPNSRSSITRHRPLSRQRNLICLGVETESEEDITPTKERISLARSRICTLVNLALRQEYTSVTYLTSWMRGDKMSNFDSDSEIGRVFASLRNVTYFCILVFVPD